MSNSDRLTIDLKGLRKRIEAFRSDPAWKTLSLAAKIRLLLEAALSQGQPLPTETIAQLIEQNWEEVSQSDIEVTLRRLREIRAGARPTHKELLELSSVLPRDSHKLTEIVELTFGKQNGDCSNEQPRENGDPAKRL